VEKLEVKRNGLMLVQKVGELQMKLEDILETKIII